MKVADKKKHVRNLLETYRKIVSRKKAEPAKLSLIAISKCYCYCSNRPDAFLCALDAKKIAEANPI